MVNLIAQVQSLHNSSGQEQVIVSYNEKVYGVYFDALGQKVKVGDTYQVGHIFIAVESGYSPEIVSRIEKCFLDGFVCIVAGPDNSSKSENIPLKPSLQEKEKEH